MADKDKWDKPAEELFFRPGVDPGMWMLDPPRDWWRVVRPGRIVGASVATEPAHHDRIEDQIAFHMTRRRFADAVETATHPVVVEGLEAAKGLIRLGDRWLLSGAAGTRIRNTHVWALEGRRDADAEVEEAMAEMRHRNPYPPAVWRASISGLDLVLDARNGYAFYHLLTETLGHLSYATRPDFTGQIILQTGSKRPTAGFVMRWIEALFPELAARVTVTQSPVQRDRALTVLNARHLHGQTGNHTMATLAQLGPDAWFWKGRSADRMTQMVLAMNGYEEGLRRLREAGLRRIAGGDWDHLPRRFWLRRRSERDRAMAGEDALVTALAKRGFAEIYFEDLTPLEQVAIMHRAEVMLGYHGAGFANMAFAGADTTVIELGTLQTCLYRWQDFMPHAHVSGCRYISLFADFNVEEPRAEVEVRSNQVDPVALEPAGRARVLALVDALIGAPGPIDDLPWLRRMGDLLLEAEAEPALRAMLSVNRKAALTDPDLTIQLANMADDAGDLRTAVALLEKAWLATGDRPFLLERLILLSTRAGIEGPWLAEHSKRYPHRANRLARRMNRG